MVHIRIGCESWRLYGLLSLWSSWSSGLNSLCKGMQTERHTHQRLWKTLLIKWSKTTESIQTSASVTSLAAVTGITVCCIVTSGVVGVGVIGVGSAVMWLFVPEMSACWYGIRDSWSGSNVCDVDLITSGVHISSLLISITSVTFVAGDALEVPVVSSAREGCDRASYNFSKYF